jgi:hypothetical protein
MDRAPRTGTDGSDILEPVDGALGGKKRRTSMYGHTSGSDGRRSGDRLAVRNDNFT